LVVAARRGWWWRKFVGQLVGEHGDVLGRGQVGEQSNLPAFEMPRAGAIAAEYSSRMPRESA